MGTQFLLSLISGAVAGAGILLILGKYTYKWYKKEPISIGGEVVAITSILLLTGAISAYKLAESSYYLAEDGVKSALHTGQQVIEKTLKWGTITVLEGVGQPYHDYQKKWEEDRDKPMQAIALKLVSSSQKISGDHKKVHLTLDITNRGTTALDLNKLFSDELIILTDKNNHAYSLKELNYQESILEAGKHTEREIEIILAKEIELHQLSSPTKQLLLLK